MVYQFIDELNRREDLDRTKLDVLKECREKMLSSVQEGIKGIPLDPIQLPEKLTLELLISQTEQQDSLHRTHIHLKESIKRLGNEIAYYENNKNSRELWVWNKVMYILVVCSYLLSAATIIIEAFIPLESYLKSQFIHILISKIGIYESYCLTMTIVVYVILCSLFALVNIQWKPTQLIEKKGTDFPTFSFYVGIASLIAPSLSFNFLTLFELDNSEFFDLMGNYNIVPIFGIHIPKMFPLLLILVCLSFIYRNLTSLWS